MPAGSRATITPVATMPPAAIPPTVAAPPAPPPGGTVGWPDGHGSGGWQFIGRVGPGLGWQRRPLPWHGGEKDGRGSGVCLGLGR